jgi:Ca2+-binding RTX toxin-like protein
VAAITVRDGAYTVPAGQMFTYSGDAFGLYADTPGGNPGLLLDGSVATTGASVVTGVDIGSTSFYDSTVTIGAMGVLNVTGGLVAYGYHSNSWGPDFTNHGVLQVTGGARAYGLYTADPGPWLFNNTAIVTVTADGDARGVVLANAATFHNSGTVTVTGGTSAVGLEMVGFNGDFLNTGLIVAHSAAHNAVGVAWTATIDPGFTWINVGAIDADVALRVSPYVPETQLQTFTNNGMMNGAIDLGPGAGALVNKGVITGDVALGAGDDIYDGRGGALNGKLDGGAGADTISGGGGPSYLRGGDGGDFITGGAGFDDINGNAGDDTITGGANGNDWLLGGQGADSITGNLGADLIYGNMGDDTLAAGDGGSTLLGGQDNDVIRGGKGDDWISGDRGSDTISGGLGADTFHAFSGSGVDIVTDFHIAEGDRVVLDPGTTYTVSQVGVDTVVDMVGGSQLVLQNVQLSSLSGGWITPG